MQTIRAEQMEVLKEARLRSFEEEMLAQLNEFSPPLYRAVGEEQMHKVVRFGITRADGYGLNFRGPVRLYLEMMLLFGSHFDTDPQFPWAAEILAGQDSTPQMQRAERLYERTLDYRKRVAGPEDAYTLKALRNISARARQPLRFSVEELESGMLTEMEYAYPEKAANVGEAGLRSLIRQGVDKARSHHFLTAREVALMIVLMFAFGHGCFDDPLYPWIGRTLNDERISDPSARARRLETKALTWLDHVLAYFDGGGGDELS